MKKIISVMLCASMLAAAVPSMAQDKEETIDCTKVLRIEMFDDIDADVPISREQFCEMVYDAIADRLIGEESDNPFNDTDNIKISALHRAGIIKGKTGVAFAPDDNLTREEAAVVITRILLLTGCILPYTAVPEFSVQYEDEDMISDWASDAVHIVRTAGIMIGDDNNSFMPKDTYTIAQAAISIVRLQDKLPQLHKAEPQTFADRLNDRMPDDKNYMFSPLSVKMALAMAANGAKGDTKSEMLDTLGIDNLDDFNEKAKNMIETYSDNDVMQLRIANSLWRNTDRDIMTSGFSDSYRKTIAEYYKGEATDVTNKNTVEKVNGWVNEKTNGKIPTIIDKPDFDAMLINAVYFKAAWENEFYERATAPDTFTSRDGSQTQIDFMHRQTWLDYSNVRGVKMLRLPYKNRIVNRDENGIVSSDSVNANVSMYIILSDNVNPEYEIEHADFESRYVSVSMPKFKIEFATGLNEILQSMGMELAFRQGKADFTNMTSAGNYFIDKTIHKTYIDVDEKGTEAAAVTAIAAGGAAMPPEPIEFKADKPFTFVIYDYTNKEVLFMGEFAYAE